MPKYFAVLILVLMIGMVMTRLWLLKRQRITGMKFGETDKTDFLIPPFALFYFYIIFAAAFGLPSPNTRELFRSGIMQWLGVASCFFGLALLLWSLISFGTSFRVGIDTVRPDKLITNGIFAYSRNPIYVAFAFILTGQFLIFPTPILLIYMIAGFWLLHRQVLREEAYLKEHYREEYARYCRRVRRYF